MDNPAEKSSLSVSPEAPRRPWFRRKSLGAVLLVVCLAIGGVLTFILWPDREPSYQGVAAGEWVEKANTNRTLLRTAADAFIAMGPDGAEFLGNELLREPPTMDEWLLGHHNKIPLTLKPLLLRPRRVVMNETVLNILEQMKAHAEPAVPMLLTWLENSTNLTGISLPANNARILRQYQGYNLVMLQMGGTNMIISLPITQAGAMQTHTQVSVGRSGVVTTNISFQIRYAPDSIPLAAHNILTNSGSEDPRCIDVLLRPPTPKPPGIPSFSTNFKSAAMRRIPLLTKTAEIGAPQQRATALAFLKLTQPESAFTREFLIRRAEQQDELTRQIIVSALENATNDLHRIVPIALQCLDKQSPLGKQPYSDAIFPSLKIFSTRSPLVIPGLQDVLLKTSIRDRCQVLQLLGEIGSIANVDTNLLKICTTHHDANVRAKAWFAMAQITGSTEAKVNEQITLIDFGLDDVVLKACDTLSTLGPDAARACDSLKGCLNRGNDRIIAAAAVALGRIGPAAKDALSDLESLQNHSRPEIHNAAREAVRLIAGEGRVHK